MNFVLKPSLEHMALIKVVICLWKQKDVRTLISEVCSGNLSSLEKWKTIEETVIEKVPQLLLSHILEEKALGFIKPIGIQLFEWIRFHCKLYSLRINLPAEFCWTPRGTFDRKKTAEFLVKDDNIDTSTRYKLACINCLEDDIKKLWNNMSKNQKEFSYSSSIITFWSQNMIERWSQHISYKIVLYLRNQRISYRTVLYQSVYSGNKVAAEYFLQKLNPRDREESIVETAKNAGDAEVLLFLLSKLNKEQQMEVFKNNTYRVLRCFLHWPFQNFFNGVANYMWEFLSKNDYNSMLNNIVHKFRDGYKDWDYQKLFREFWQKSPDALKSCILDDLDRGQLLKLLISVKDKESIRLIVKDATLAAKKRFIFRSTGKKFCEDFIRANEWDFLEFFIQEFLPSVDEMFKFKEEFEKLSCPDVKKYFAGNDTKWDQIFQLSEDSICKYSKRSLEEEECSSSKRFKSLQ